MTIKAYNFQVYGRVQGVFFRQSTLAMAQELGLCGFVRNNADGSVCGYAEGEAEALESFRQWLLHGPDQAKVSQLDIDYVEDFSKPAEFIIRY